MATVAPSRRPAFWAQVEKAERAEKKAGKKKPEPTAPVKSAAAKKGRRK
jgi:hypothetical protein